MMIFSIHWVFVCVYMVYAMALGMLWYGPFFSKPFILGMGYQRIEDFQAEKKHILPAFLGSLGAHLVNGTLLSLFASNLGFKTLGSLLFLAFLLALGTISNGLMNHLWTRRTAYWIDGTYVLACLLGGAFILSAFVA